MSSSSDAPELPRQIAADEAEALTRPTQLSTDAEESSTEASGDGSAVGAPNGDPKGRSGRIPNHVLDSVALMVINGATYEHISASTGIKQDTLQRLVTEGHNQYFTKALQTYRDKILRATTHHQMRLMDMMEHSYRAVSQALISDDEKLAADTAFKLWDRVVPQKPETQLEVNVGVGNIHLDTQVRKTFNAIGEKFEHLMDHLLHDDPNKYIREESGVYEIPVQRTDPKQITHTLKLEGEPAPDEPEPDAAA